MNRRLLTVPLMLWALASSAAEPSVQRVPARPATPEGTAPGTQPPHSPEAKTSTGLAPLPASRASSDTVARAPAAPLPSGSAPPPPGEREQTRPDWKPSLDVAGEYSADSASVLIVPMGKAAPIESKGRYVPRVTLRLRSPRRWVAIGIFDGREFVGTRTALDAGDRPVAGAVPTPLRFTRLAHDTLMAVMDSSAAGSVLERWVRRAVKPVEPPEQTVVAPPAPEGQPRFGEYVYVEELPEAITKVAPIYPEAARRAGIVGTVMVQALVGKDGRVAEARVTQSIPALDQAAIVAVQQWRFKPAMGSASQTVPGGTAPVKLEPVAVWVAVPVRFSLH